MTVLAYPTIDPPKETPKSSEIEAAMRVLTVLADPNACKATLEKLAAATEAHKAAAAEAEQAKAEAERERAELEGRLAGEKEQVAKLWADHEHKVEASQRQHDERLKAREVALANRETKAVATDAEYVKRFQDLDRRMKLLRDAGAM
jgi:hypothetical protein